MHSFTLNSQGEMPCIFTKNNIPWSEKIFDIQIIDVYLIFNM